jgi:lipoprotein-releasing system permease protein
MSRSRFQTFVALRYLMAHPMHVSWLALIVAGVAAAAGGVLLAVAHFAFAAPDPRALVPTVSPAQQVLAQIGSVALIVAGVCVYVFLIRVFFTFYSTVSIVGVSIGCAALVTVLSIMNGFEADLRVKILGSNAHLQVSKEDGEFVEWEEVRAKIDQVPGVVASTPFATSEVVIAANSNYSNVVVKGIDVASATRVTALRKNLADPEALGRLEPLVPDPMEPPSALPAAPSDPGAIDPAPADLPTAGDPVDWSDPGAGPPAVDPAPDDFAEGAEIDPDARPRDLSGQGTAAEADAAARLPSRVQTLSGVLVGRELRKTMHTFDGQEVRLVSPLSDPMNPDANGTPIPFNRDYRVAGEFFTGMYEYDLKLVYVSLESLQEFLRLGDAVDGIEVRIKNPDDVDAMAKRISAAIGPEYHVQGWRELNRNLFSALKLEKIAMFMILAIIIIVASFSIVGTLIMTVIEKARQIALLKTLGASDLEIVVVFVTQGSLIGFIGGTIGVGVGLGLCLYLKTFGYPIPAEVYYIDRLPVQVDYLTCGAIYVAALVISFAATIYPSILGAQLRPAVGLKKA